MTLVGGGGAGEGVALAPLAILAQALRIMCMVGYQMALFFFFYDFVWCINIHYYHMWLEMPNLTKHCEIPINLTMLIFCPHTKEFPKFPKC